MSPDRPFRLGRAAPGVPVRDIETALAFYVGVLGMTETLRKGDPVGFVIVERDDAEIHLTLQPARRATTANVVHLMVDDATALHEQRLLDHGVRIVKGIRDAD
jgi:catechol 2,3-dioxygenase-like lactoylglutathione lyase family enzyme